VRERTTPLLTAAFATALLAGCGGSPAGGEAYRAGRFADAARAFAAAVEDAGDDAPPALLHDLALSAVRAGDLRAAESAADRLAAAGDDGEKALAGFLRGLASFARAETAAGDAARPGADRLVRDRAVAHAQAAKSRFERAAAARDDWPEARRNAERAAILLKRLLRDRDVADSRKKDGAPPPGPDAPPPPLPPPGGPREDPAAPPPAAADGEIPRDQVLGLLRRLASMDEEKAAARRARRAAAQSGVERDW